MWKWIQNAGRDDNLAYRGENRDTLLLYVSQALATLAPWRGTLSPLSAHALVTHEPNSPGIKDFLRHSLSTLIPLDTAEVPLSATLFRRAARSLTVLSDENEFECTTPEEAVRLGGANVIGQRYGRALHWFDEALARGGADFEAGLGRARSLSGLSRDQEALQACETAIALRPQNPSGLLERSFILSKLDRPMEALQASGAALELNGSAHEALERHATLLASCGRLDEALMNAEAARSIAPAEACAVVTHADILSQAGRSGDAVRAGRAAMDLVSRSLRLDPLDLRCRSIIVPLFMRLGQPEKALAHCTEALELAPHKHAWHFLRGQLYCRLQAPEKALQDFVAASDAENVWWVQRAKALVLGQQLDRWQECLDALRDIPSESPSVASIRGLAHADLGDHNAALPLYDLALSVYPNDRAALYNRAWSLYEVGRKREAMLAFRAFVQGHPSPHLGKRWARTDPDLRSMRRDPEVASEFRTLMHERFSLRNFLADRGFAKPG